MVTPWLPELVETIQDYLCPSAPPFPTQMLQTARYLTSRTASPQTGDCHSVFKKRAEGVVLLEGELVALTQ